MVKLWNVLVLLVNFNHLLVSSIERNDNEVYSWSNFLRDSALAVGKEIFTPNSEEFIALLAQTQRMFRFHCFSKEIFIKILALR